MKKQFLRYLGDHIVRLSTNLEAENKELKKVIKSLVSGAHNINNIITTIITTFYWKYKDFIKMKYDTSYTVYIINIYKHPSFAHKVKITKTPHSGIFVNFDDQYNNEEYNVLVHKNNSKWTYLDANDPSIVYETVLGIGQMSGLIHYNQIHYIIDAEKMEWFYSHGEIQNTTRRANYNAVVNN